MNVKHNLDRVAKQLERLKQAIPIAAKESLAREHWYNVAVRIADMTLNNIPGITPAERRIIPRFISTIVAGMAEEGVVLLLSMKAPDSVERVEGFRAVAEALEAGEEVDRAQMRTVAEQWVHAPPAPPGEDGGGKRWKETDFRNPDAVADFIAFLFSSPGADVGARRDARMSLRPHILAWLRQTGEAMDAATVDAWLRAVLLAWRQMVKDRFPIVFDAELRRLMGQTGQQNLFE